MAKAVKLADIASAVGVSTVTVSKALSDQKGVSEELRGKIKQLAQEMGYQPPAATRKTRPSKQYNIGVLIQEIYLDKYASFYWQLYQDLTRRTLMRGCFTMLELVSRNDVMGCHMPIMAKEHRVDGIVVIGSMETHYIQELEETAGVPIVYMDYYDNTRQIDTVISNSFYGCYMLTNYLFEMGHRDIGYVGTLCATNSITDRYLGYEKALMEHRVPVRDEWVFPDRDLMTGMIDLEMKMRLPKQLPTAFVCNSDLTAAHLIKYLERRGYHVPDDFSVVGFDNYLYPGLCDIGITTYEVDISEMARKTFQKLLKRMANEKSTTGTVIVDGHLVCKDSVARR